MSQIAFLLMLIGVLASTARSDTAISLEAFVGEPSGGAIAIEFTPHWTARLGAGRDFRFGGAWQAELDMLYEGWEPVSVGRMRVRPYPVVGINWWDGDDGTWWAIRTLAGFEGNRDASGMSIFIETGPAWYWQPRDAIEFQGVIGLRWRR
jgi:hypothetical protein